MTRALSLFGMGALFVIISPVLRTKISQGVWLIVGFLDRTSPYSYIVGVLALLTAFGISLNRGSRPR